MIQKADYPEWRSADEATDDMRGERFLVVVNYEILECRMVEIMRYRKHGGWEFDKHESVSVYVTHFMPIALPELPEA